MKVIKWLSAVVLGGLLLYAIYIGLALLPATDFFRVQPERVVELGIRIEL